MWRADLVPGLHRFFQGISPEKSLSGWERVSWGDSFADVVRNYPQAGEKNGQLILTPADPVQRPWTLTFDFDASRQLSSVTLSFAGSQETADFATLSQEITNRLGAPVQSTDATNVWRRDDSEITLSTRPDGGVVLSETV